MPIHNPKNILIAPLDWGLGHTTRCLPIIRYIRALGHRVIVAGNEWQAAFLRANINDIEIINLEGYNVTYSKWNRVAQIGVLAQLPGLYKTIAIEHSWLRDTVKDMKIDGVISDNRYGLFHPNVPSVIMTHQLQVQTGMGNMIDRTVQKVHYKYLDRFSATWVVDSLVSRKSKVESRKSGDIDERFDGLGGILSHPVVLPKRCGYLGLLSQFEGIEIADNGDDNLLILLSGPEPMRSDLSQLLWKQACAHKGKITFVEGSNSVVPPAQIPPHITYHKWLANDALAAALQSTGMVICRSGYSTIMDLVALRKKAILIPTPGQTEQEYLGKYLREQGIFYSAKQSGFDLSNAMKEAAQFPYHAAELRHEYEQYKQVVSDWVQAL